MTRKWTLRPLFTAVLLIAVTITSISCVELEAIRKFTENSAAVSENFPSLSSDIYGSCVRGYRFRFTEVSDYQPTLMLKIDGASSAVSLDGYDATGVPLAGNKSLIQSEMTCRKLKASHKAATLINKTLVDYMKTLGELAADDLTSYDANLGKLGTSVGATGFFEQKHIDAGKGLAGLILKATTERWRRGKLRAAINDRDKDVATITKVLRDYISVEYVRMLEIEKETMNSFYTELIRNHQAADNPNQMSVMLIKDQWDGRSSELSDRLASAMAYGDITHTVEAGHHKLYENQGDLGSKEVQQMVLQYAKDIESLVGIFRKAFK